MVCKSGDKPTVLYSFANGNQKRFQSLFSPIQVVTRTKPVSGSDNYDASGFKLTYVTSQFSLEFFSGVVRDFVTYYKGNTLYILKTNCDGSTSEGYLDRPNKSITVDTSIRCPGLPKQEKCSIIISHNGQSIFQDQGDCPISWDVQCGKCPEGTCECPSPIYPGYCCLDCAATAASIRTITNNLRAKNG